MVGCKLLLLDILLSTPHIDIGRVIYDMEFSFWALCGILIYCVCILPQ